MVEWERPSVGGWWCYRGVVLTYRLTRREQKVGKIKFVGEWGKNRKNLKNLGKISKDVKKCGENWRSDKRKFRKWEKKIVIVDGGLVGNDFSGIFSFLILYSLDFSLVLVVVEITEFYYFWNFELVVWKTVVKNTFHISLLVFWRFENHKFSWQDFTYVRSGKFLIIIFFFDFRK